MTITKVMAALRQTGRTFRMLGDAQDTARRQGSDVYVIFYNQEEIDHIHQSANIAAFSGLILMPLCNAGDIIDIETLKSKNPEKYTVFIDHGLIESKFNYLVTMLHTYDKHLGFSVSDVKGMSFNPNGISNGINQRNFTLDL